MKRIRYVWSFPVLIHIKYMLQGYEDDPEPDDEDDEDASYADEEYGVSKKKAPKKKKQPSKPRGTFFLQSSRKDYALFLN
jgi:hypothetical protein